MNTSKKYSEHNLRYILTNSFAEQEEVVVFFFLALAALQRIAKTMKN